jgi:alkaline phosphatase D
MRRRDFLRATLVSAGAVLVGTGCGSDERELTPGEAYFPQSVASGDPKSDSVILWTRVVDPASPGRDFSVELEMATDAAFTSLVSVNGSERLAVTAAAAFDNCLKVKVKGLTAGTVYYYRFVYTLGEIFYVSRVGRTKTAPAPDADVPVKFAFVSCQDFIGKYYNAYLRLARADIDFIVHLGDYVYETTGDPSFQVSDESRKVTFTDTAGAIAFNDPATYYAAKSLDNYRELYKKYRGDRALQGVHEKFAMIITWDDHEFSDDCHGATASYFDERADENDVTRRKNANKAWFEYMPVDYAEEGFVYDEKAEYPNDIRIYRDFKFGKHVHLAMTDLRSYRPDHLIPEGAFPGKVVVEQTFLTSVGFPLMAAKPYVDVDSGPYVDYKLMLVNATKAVEPEYDTSKIAGNVAVDYINAVIASTMSPLPPIDDAMMTLERGFAFMHMGKTTLHGQLGSRYLIIKDTFDLYGANLLATTAGESENVMGKDQEDWFLAAMQGSTSTWKVWGNEYCLFPIQVDLSMMSIPDAFKQRFYMNVDSWDGFRNKRSQLIEKLASVGNVVAITGDIHAFYAATPNVNGDISKRIIELVTSSITSQTFRDELITQIQSDPALAATPGLDQLAKAVDDLMMTAVNPHLGYAKSDANGYVVVEAGATELIATYHLIPTLKAKADFTGNESTFEQGITTVRFKTVAGENNLYRDFDGTWKRWDQATVTYV